jgi:hypothetical protein
MKTIIDSMPKVGHCNSGILLIIGSFLSILPVFGLWMLPLGMVMLAQDVPFIKRLIDRLLAWIEWKHPKWLGLPAG